MDQLFKINEVVCDQNRHQKEAGEPRLVRKFSKMSSVNILGAFFRWLPTRRNYAGSIVKFVDLTLGITHVQSTEMSARIQICKR